MKKTVMMFLLLALTVGLFACTAVPDAADTQPRQIIETEQVTDTTQAEPTERNTFYSEAEDDYVRYTGGGISILLEGGFTAETAQEGYIVYTNGFLTVVLAETDDYDAQMLASYGYDMAQLTEEEYGSILIDTNDLDTDSLFYDYFNNVCLQYGGQDSNGNEYEAYSVIKKDTSANTFWLIQFIGAPSVYEPYSVYFPEWADSATFG